VTDTFTNTVWDYYNTHARFHLPWRFIDEDDTINPYYVIVSEIMLQQTQVDRVIPKFEAFIAEFPSWQELAAAPQSDVLRAWQGLGYNRRARFLHQAAQIVVQEYGGVVPYELEKLIALPGIGKNTAAAVLVYSYNIPHIFIETNIRTVFLHHFFQDQSEVKDATILQLVERASDIDNPREWYWALMDYGTYLKKQKLGHLHKSAAHKKQSPFKGSKRELRGKVIKILLGGQRTKKQLATTILDDRLANVLDDLVNEQLIARNGNAFTLK
jgi:A/G-specific adenine glycosylase